MSEHPARTFEVVVHVRGGEIHGIHDVDQRGYDAHARLWCLQVPNEECERCVLEAIDVGYRLIDTAQSYGNEEGVGHAIVHCGVPREELFITSKMWISWGVY